MSRTLPDYASYDNTAAASLFPANATVADIAHKQQGIVGYVHPFDFVPDPAGDPVISVMFQVILTGGVFGLAGKAGINQISWYSSRGSAFPAHPAAARR